MSNIRNILNEGNSVQAAAWIEQFYQNNRYDFEKIESELRKHFYANIYLSFKYEVTEELLSQLNNSHPAHCLFWAFIDDLECAGNYGRDFEGVACRDEAPESGYLIQGVWV